VTARGARVVATIVQCCCVRRWLLVTEWTWLRTAEDHACGLSGRHCALVDCESNRCLSRTGPQREECGHISRPVSAIATCVQPLSACRAVGGCIYRVMGVTSLPNIPAKMYLYLSSRSTYLRRLTSIKNSQIQPPISCNRHPCRTHIICIIQAVLDFFSTTDVGKLVLAEEDAGSGVPAWERREREEEELGAGEELLLFLPTPSFMASAGEE